MSEKTTSITEAIQSGDKIPPSVYQMWIDELLQERATLVEGLKQILDVGKVGHDEGFTWFKYSEINHAKCLDLAHLTLKEVGEVS